MKKKKNDSSTGVITSVKTCTSVREINSLRLSASQLRITGSFLRFNIGNGNAISMRSLLRRAVNAPRAVMKGTNARNRDIRDHECAHGGFQPL